MKSMRELKFRMPIYYNGKFKDWHYWGFINDDEWGLRFESPHSDYRTCPSDQFTGVKDDFGKEIYEGDLVSFVDISDYGYPYVGCIEVFKGSFVAKTKYSKFDLNDARDIEVVGNIHQNPELIKPC